MEQVAEFLEKNGFKETLKDKYSNDQCTVLIGKRFYTIANNEYDLMFSEDLNIYWLIGVLTYYDYMDKNYKQ